jgi:hypothetical protein
MLDPASIALLSQFGVSAEAAEAAATSLLVLTAVSVVAAVPTGMLAKRKGRSVTAWVVFALSLPVLPLILIWFLPRKPTP